MFPGKNNKKRGDNIKNKAYHKDSRSQVILNT